jgi:PKD repeat protein
MSVFQIGKAVETTTPTVSVDVTAAAPLAVGAHKFQLVVVDEKGNHSKPTTVTVNVKDPVLPTAILTAPSLVIHGSAFELDGSKSSELPPDKIVSYSWTLLD